MSLNCKLPEVWWESDSDVCNEVTSVLVNHTEASLPNDGSDVFVVVLSSLV